METLKGSCLALRVQASFLTSGGAAIGRPRVSATVRALSRLPEGAAWSPLGTGLMM